MIHFAVTDIHFASAYDQPVRSIGRRRSISFADFQSQIGTGKAEPVGDVRDHDGFVDGNRAELLAGRVHDRDGPVEAAHVSGEGIDALRLVCADRDREPGRSVDEGKVVNQSACAGIDLRQVEIHDRVGKCGYASAVHDSDPSGQLSACQDKERGVLVEHDAVRRAAAGYTHVAVPAKHRILGKAAVEDM